MPLMIGRITEETSFLHGRIYFLAKLVSVGLCKKKMYVQAQRDFLYGSSYIFARVSTSAGRMMKKPPLIENISPLLRLHRFKDGVNTPLALMLPWATATESALDRFRTLYAQQGFNVLTVYATHPKLYLWPRLAEPVVDELSKYIRTETGSAPIVVHAFSVGAYIYSVMLARVIEQNHELVELKPRICGQVFDSIVFGTPKERRRGLAEALTNSWLLKLLISTSTAIYLQLTYRYTVAFHEKVIDIFWNNPFKTSALFIYSSEDPMCKTETMERGISVWEDRTGHPAHFKKFTGSHHAECLRRFPEEYRDSLFKYLNTLKIRDRGPYNSKL